MAEVKVTGSSPTSYEALDNIRRHALLGWDARKVKMQRSFAAAAFRGYLQSHVPNLYAEFSEVSQAVESHQEAFAQPLLRYHFWNGVRAMLLTHLMGRSDDMQISDSPVSDERSRLVTGMLHEPWLWTPNDDYDPQLQEVLATLQRKKIMQDQDDLPELEYVFGVGAKAAHVLDGTNRFEAEVALASSLFAEVIGESDLHL